MNPLVTTVSLTLDRPSQADKRADRERLIDGLAGIGFTDPVSIDAQMLRMLSPGMRENDFSITVTIGFIGHRLKVMALNKVQVYAVAIDVGTTNIVASLFNLTDNRKIDVKEHENPQIATGLDVLTRVQVSMGGKGGELHRLIMAGINDLIKDLCLANNIESTDIYASVIAGNTIMTHFLLNLPVDTIPVEPYIPVFHNVDFLEPHDVGIDINQQGIVYVFPNAGSYVGGDIIAGILSSGLYKKRETSMLIDVGTNAEIVLGCDEWIVVGAGAAGPALEGGIAEIGMRATEGAICGVEIGDPDFTVRLKTVGDKKPAGVCGSGMIELVSELYKAGIIDRQGRMTKHGQRVKEINGHLAFVIYESDHTKLMIKDTDIENFLRSKAAMFASLYVIVKSVGLGFQDIAAVYVSGAFGAGIDTQKAVNIGMVPDIARDKFTAIGNSSLKGAELLLMYRELLTDIDSICRLITYREMNTDGEFMKEFPAALFIPHTNPEVLKG